MRVRECSWCLTFSVVVGLSLTGCQAAKLNRGQAYRDDEAAWGKSLRPPAASPEKFFFNKKSQQIEESLGM